MTTARKIDAHLQARRANNPNAVRVIVLDGDTVHCLNEGLLDTWWNALPPVVKAEIYELSLGDEAERCIHCGCTQQRACPGGCAWLDAKHTVCSAIPCATKHIASMRASLADSMPLDRFLAECDSTVASMSRAAIATATRLLAERGGVDAHC